MQRRLEGLRREFLKRRKKRLAERPRIFNDYINSLIDAVKERASIILFGGHARTGKNTVEPRDYDLLIVSRTNNDLELLEELVNKLRPKNLPLDIIIASIDDIAKALPIVEKMLEHHIILHDPLNVRRVIHT